MRYTHLQSLGGGTAPPRRRRRSTVYQYDERPALDLAVERRHPDALPWATALDVEYTGQHAYNLRRERQHQRRRFRRGVPGARTRIRRWPRRRPGAAAVQADQMRAFRGYSSITQAAARGYLDRSHAADVVQPPLPQRLGVRVQRRDPAVAEGQHHRAPAAQRRRHATPSVRTRRRPTSCSADFIPVRHTLKGNFVWDAARLAQRARPR